MFSRAATARHEELEAFEARVDRRFTASDVKLEELAFRLESCHKEVVNMLRGLQAQVHNLEMGQAQLKTTQLSFLARSPGREVPGSRPQSARILNGYRDLPVHQVKIAAPNSHCEVAPLLRPEPENDNSKLTFQEKLARAQEGMAKGKPQQNWSVKLVTQFLEDPESGAAAMYYSWFILVFNVFAIVIGLLPLVDNNIPEPYAAITDVAIDSLLLSEIIVRMLFSPSLSAFWADPSNIIDLMSGLPLLVYVTIATSSNASQVALCESILTVATPVIRLLRFVRRFPDMQILISAFKNIVEALPVLLYTMTVLACVFTSGVYLVEPRDNIGSMSEAGWMVLSTMTTVGFGDVVPQSRAGHALTGILMIVSPLYMAMPFGIIGYSFTVIWGNRSQILLLQGTRNRLAKWGFGPYEIPKLFSLFDMDDSAEIDVQEFQLLMKEMEVGFKDDEIVDLFKAIDKDAGGSIDEREFVKTLYPSEFRFMYGRKRKEEGDAQT